MEKDLDNKLYNDYLNGNEEAFEELYNKYKSRIKYFIYNILHDYQIAEDLMQETFLYVMQNKMKENCNFKYYIYLKAKSFAFSFINVENRRNEILKLYVLNDNEQIEKDVLEDILDEENKNELIEAIECLDEKYKNAIYLVSIEKLSYEETSKILGETLQNVKNLVHRGKIQLRKILIKKGFYEMNKVAKILIIMIVTTTIISGIVYAISNVKISEKPVFEWFNFNFSDEYENYREEIHGESIQSPKESSIDLVSSVCDEGVVILEFDIKLSEQDKKYLKIGEPRLTKEYINATDDEDSRLMEEDYDKENHLIVQKSRKDTIKEMLGDKKVEDVLCVGCNLKPGTFEDSKIMQKRMNRYAIIDGEYNWVQVTTQSVKKISEYEYKLYKMYFLTAEELGDKTEFTLTMKDFIITTEEMQYGDQDTCLEFDGQFDIELSKEKAVQNSKKIEVNCDEVIYDDKDLTQKIESVVVTPLQTIVKIHSIYENVNDSKLTDSRREDHIGLNNYEVLDENGEKVNSHFSEIKRKITYSDGKQEEWSVGQIEVTRDSFENATLETIEYIFIEKHENNSKIKIISQDGNGIKNIEYTDIGSFEIDLTKEQPN